MVSVFNSTESFFGAVPSVTVSPALLGISAESGANVPFLWTSTAVFGVLLFVLFNRTWSDGNGHKIPKGPRGVPILGSFPFLTKYPELTLDYWAQRFGKPYSVWLGNQLFVIVSDPNIATDLMVTNGNVFSRKEMFIKSQTVFAGRGITVTPYNDRWRKHRRIATTWLNQRAVDSYSPTLDHESMSLVKALWLESKGGQLPVNPQPHAGRCSLNNMTTITFGLRTDSIKHPLVMRALKLQP